MKTIAASLLLALATAGAGAAGAWTAGAADDTPAEIFQEARAALDDGDYRAAAALFGEVAEDHPASDLAGDALYWQAFAYYRLDRVKYLKKALAALSRQIEEYPAAGTRGDAEDLLVRIEGKLARQGDAEASRNLAEKARDVDRNLQDERRGGERDGDREIDDGLKMATLNALMNMDSAKARPILKKILDGHGKHSAELRQQALFILVQGDDAEDSAAILLDVARNDPDEDVRGQAVFWLSQVPGDEPVVLLEEILGDGGDPRLQEQAVFALSQHGGDRARQVMRRLVVEAGRRDQVREQAIFWLANEGDDDDVRYLMEVYPRLEGDELREQIVFGVANSGNPEGVRWLYRIVEDEGEDEAVRTNALFWVGESGGLDLADLMRIYRQTDSGKMREQVLFVLSQQDDGESLDHLIEIARSEKDPKLRENAIFWISQSDDPRAEGFLLEIIDE